MCHWSWGVAALAAPSARAIHGSRPHPHGVSTGCQSLNHMVPWHRQEGNAQQDENTRADAAHHPLGTHARPCSGARARRGRRGLSCSSHQHAFTAGTLQNHTAPVVTVRAPWRPPSAAALGRTASISVRARALSLPSMPPHLAHGERSTTHYSFPCGYFALQLQGTNSTTNARWHQKPISFFGAVKTSYQYPSVVDISSPPA